MGSSLNRYRVLVLIACALLAVLLSVLAGLTTIVSFFGTRACDLLTPEEVDYYRQHPSSPFNASAEAPGLSEVVPRVLHWTVQDEIPSQWQGIHQACRDMHPDYQYMVWSEAEGRKLIADRYPWFLERYDSYRYPVQRADARRYFALYEYGGVYLDIDVGCISPVDPLLNFPVVLPETRPVGVGNDIIVSARGHPLMKAAIDSLASFDHSFVTKYATVMFSTGPMFLSAIAASFVETDSGLRILPRTLYGKYPQEGDVEGLALFKHYFWSSWHGDDANSVLFVIRHGIAIIAMSSLVMLAFLLRHLWLRRRAQNTWLADDDESRLLPESDEKRPYSPVDAPSLGSRRGSAASPVSYAAPSPVLPPPPKQD